MTAPKETNLSQETAEFLLQLVNRVTLSADDPQFEAMATKIVRAKRELEQVVGE